MSKVSTLTQFRENDDGVAVTPERRVGLVLNESVATHSAVEKIPDILATTICELILVV